MRIGIPAEICPGETRVAATPETVKKLTAGGRHTVIVETGAGVGASIPDAEFRGGRRDARLRRGRLQPVRHHPQGARPEDVGAAAAAPREHPRRPAEPASGRRAAGADRRDRLRHGAAAAHHARAGDGRAVVAGATSPATRP